MMNQVTKWYDKVEEFCEEHEYIALTVVSLIITIVTLIPALIAAVIIEKIKAGV